MNMQIDWSLLNRPQGQPSPFAGAQQGFERGAVQSALSLLRANPNDPRAMNALMAFAPELGVQMEDRAFRVGERGRAADSRNALADMLLGNGQGQGLSTSDLPPTPNQGAAAQDIGPGGVPVGAPGGTALTPPPQTVSSSSFAQPTTGATNALMSAGPPSGLGVDPAIARERAIRADPQAFLEADGRNTQNQRHRVQLSQEQFELVRDINEQTLQLLGGIGQVPEEQRPAAWQAALARAEGLYARFGMNVREHVPAEYDPATYDQLMRSAMKTREQFSVMQAENRLDWDIEDDTIDNRRADRGMDSLIGYRNDQIRLGIRSQDMIDVRGRRGQDMSSADRRRGQDIGSGDRRRGQDVGSADRRRGQDQRPARGRRSSGGNAARAVLNGRPIVVRNNAWVFEDTGQPAR